MSGAPSSYAENVLAQPRTGVPFLESFRVVHGPPGLLGRFFISADERLRERGMTLQFIPFDELTGLSKRNADSWGSFNPMFDPGFADIPKGSMCLAAFDKHGSIKICICGKPFDARTESFADLVNSGRFACIRRDRNVDQIETQITAPFAYELKGLLSYAGAVWVHPDERGDRYASIFVHIVNACMMTLWDPAHLLGSVPNTTMGTGLYQRYGYSHSISPLIITAAGKQVADLAIIHISAHDFIAGLAIYLDEIWPKFDAAVASRNR